MNWHYKIIIMDKCGRKQEHFTNAETLEAAITEAQSLADYASLNAWVNYAIGESGRFDQAATAQYGTMKTALHMIANLSLGRTPPTQLLEHVRETARIALS